jgi:hypothetical protein
VGALSLRDLVFIQQNIEVRTTKKEKGKKNRVSLREAVLPVHPVLPQVVQPVKNNYSVL